MQFHGSFLNLFIVTIIFASNEMYSMVTPVTRKDTQQTKHDSISQKKKTVELIKKGLLSRKQEQSKSSNVIVQQDEQACETLLGNFLWDVRHEALRINAIEKLTPEQLIHVTLEWPYVAEIIEVKNKLATLDYDQICDFFANPQKSPSIGRALEVPELRAALVKGCASEFEQGHASEVLPISEVVSKNRQQLTASNPMAKAYEEILEQRYKAPHPASNNPTAKAYEEMLRQRNNAQHPGFNKNQQAFTIAKTYEEMDQQRDKAQHPGFNKIQPAVINPTAKTYEEMYQQRDKTPHPGFNKNQQAVINNPIAKTYEEMYQQRNNAQHPGFNKN